MTIYNKLDYRSRDKALLLSDGGHIGLFAFRRPEGFPALYAVVFKNIIPITHTVQNCKNLSQSA